MKIALFSSFTFAPTLSEQPAVKIPREEEGRWIAAQIKQNLTSHQSQVIALVNRVRLPLPHTTWSGKLKVTYLHLSHHRELYRELKRTLLVVSLALVVISALALLLSHLPSTLVALKWVAKGVALEHYVDRRIAFVFFTALGGASLLIKEGPRLRQSVQQWWRSWKEYWSDERLSLLYMKSFPSSCAAKREICLGNRVDEQGRVQQLILDGSIDKAWIEAPRFIRIGPYLCSLDELLPTLFSNGLSKGSIRHPIELRELDRKEQKELLDDLSRLFLMPKEEILACWEVERYLQAYRKPSTSPSGSEGLWELFKEDLKEKVGAQWWQLDEQERAEIAHSISRDMYSYYRIIGFLRKLPHEVLQVAIQKTQEESFTLGQLLEQAEQLAFDCVFSAFGEKIKNSVKIAANPPLGVEGLGQP